MFFSFYSIFCLGSTKNEVHICNLHAKTQLLMYDKGGLSTKKFSSPEGRWRTVRKPGLDENSGFEWKNLYFLYQWPKRNSFQGYSFLNSILMQIWDTLTDHTEFELCEPVCVWWWQFTENISIYFSIIYLFVVRDPVKGGNVKPLVSPVTMSIQMSYNISLKTRSFVLI